MYYYFVKIMLINFFLISYLSISQLVATITFSLINDLQVVFAIPTGYVRDDPISQSSGCIPCTIDLATFWKKRWENCRALIFPISHWIKNRFSWNLPNYGRSSIRIRYRFCTHLVKYLYSKWRGGECGSFLWRKTSINLVWINQFKKKLVSFGNK